MPRNSTWGKTDINNNNKCPTQKLSYHFTKITSLWTVCLMSVNFLTAIHFLTELETLITFYLLLSLLSLLIHQILPAQSQKSLWNPAILFISTSIIQAFIWTIVAVLPYSSLCQQNYFPIK